MSSFLCFICHSTVNADTNEETREKYRDVVGMNLCPDSHLCFICCHVLNKLWLYKSICLKRSLEYPVLFSEKGTINLQRTDLEVHVLCPEDSCEHYQNRNINFKSYHYAYDDYHTQYESQQYTDNKYVELQEDNFDEFFKCGNKCKEYDCNFQNDEQSEQTNMETNIPDSDDQYMEQSIDSSEEIDNKSLPEYKEQVDTQTDIQTDIHYPNDSEVMLEKVNNDIPDLFKIDTLKNQDQTEYGTDDQTIEKKVKFKKSRKRGFNKIVLSLDEQKAELEALRKEKKYIESEFKCYSCALGFLFKDTYQAHMMRHEESNGEYLCLICGLRFASPAVLRSHNAAHTLRYRCAHCSLTVRPRGRSTHAARCPVDPNTSVSGSPKSAAACHLCAALFRDSSRLQQHLKRFHKSKISGKSYSCNVCGKNYNNQSAVRTHMIKHINKKFPCDQCSSTFASPYTLAQHKKKHATISDQSNHYCDTCGLTYSSRKSLLAHKRNALIHQQTVFDCSICNRICPNQRALASHVETVHSQDKKYSCGLCGARYSSRKSLLAHIRTHTQKNRRISATCHLCGSNFKSNSKLNRHLREVCEKAKLEEHLSSLYDQE